MKTKIGCWALVVLTALAGCVPSLNPIYTNKQLVFDPDVVGLWTDPNGQDTWEFVKRDAQSYELVYTDRDEQQGRFIAHLANLDGTLFLDLFPEDIDRDAAGFYKFHVVPIHTIYRVRHLEPNLALAAVDYRWLDAYLTDNPGVIQFTTFNGRKLITAPTEDLQAFVVEHKEMFTANFKLVRPTEPLS